MFLIFSVIEHVEIKLVLFFIYNNETMVKKIAVILYDKIVHTDRAMVSLNNKSFSYTAMKK